jgi:hypothetical protein
MSKFVCVLFLSLLVVQAAAGEEEHGDHEEPYEWGGMFEGSSENYFWVAQKVEGAYAEPTLKMVVVATDSTSEDDFEAAQETAETLLEAGGCTAVAAGGTITPSASACIELTFDSSDYESKFVLSALGADSGVAIFTEHSPSEFEANSHYLRDEDGHDVEPVHSTDEEEAFKGASLGMVMLGCFVVNLLTFSGVILVACSVKGLSKFAQGVLNGFASGTLIAVAAFLMIIESIHLVMNYEWTPGGSEVDYTWRWGTALLAGFLMPTVFHFGFSLLGLDVAHYARGGQIEVSAENEKDKRLKEVNSNMVVDLYETFLTSFVCLCVSLNQLEWR